MFYSHQLLARKAPLGQIWMAATLHGKINRRKLDKLNIINICEEILNPSIPMALRLSGILMGGVVIVYERKVKLLYDDVTRLMVDINQAWKPKPVSDPTVLPKGKSHAKKEAVTLPEKKDADLEDVIEASLNFSNSAATAMEFQQTAYFAMRLDKIDEVFVNNDQGMEDVSHQPHQANADNINLFERFDSFQANTETYNHFERFDIDMDEETQPNFASGERADIPTTLIPSPPGENNAHDIFNSKDVNNCQLPWPPAADGIEDERPVNQANQQSDEFREVKQDVQRQGQVKRNVNRHAGPAMDYEQTIIPGHVYQTWLQNTSDIVSKRGRKRKSRKDILSSRKVANLMELPPMVLIDDLYNKSNGEIHYPPPIMELWMQSTRPPHDIPSERTSHSPPPVSSPPQQFHHEEQLGNVFQEFHSGVGSQSLGASMEKQRANIQQAISTEIPDFLIRKSDPNLISNGTRVAESVFMTPGNSANDVRSMSSSGSEHGIPENPHRLNKKRTGSASRHSGSSLEVVAEEPNYPDPNFRLSRLSENGPTTDPELLVETGPTQTQRPIISQPFDQITDKIKTQMKAHFEIPGNPQTESLNKLADGLSRKQAAFLFYQTCVLATRDFLKVQQKVPYGDILISKGAKM